MKLLDIMSAREIVDAIRGTQELWLVHATSRTAAIELFKAAQPDSSIPVHVNTEMSDDRDRRSASDALAFAAELARPPGPRIIVVRVPERIKHDTSDTLQFAQEVILQDPEALDRIRGFRNSVEARLFYRYDAGQVLRGRDSKTARELETLVESLAVAIAASLRVAMTMSSVRLTAPDQHEAELVLASWLLLPAEDRRDAAFAAAPEQITPKALLRDLNLLMFARRPALISLLWRACKPTPVPVPIAAGKVSHKPDRTRLPHIMAEQAAAWLVPAIAWLDEVLRAHQESTDTLAADPMSIEARIALLTGMAPIVENWKNAALAAVRSCSVQFESEWRRKMDLLERAYGSWLQPSEHRDCWNLPWVRAQFLHQRRGCDGYKLQSWLSSKQ